MDVVLGVGVGWQWKWKWWWWEEEREGGGGCYYGERALPVFFFLCVLNCSVGRWMAGRVVDLIPPGTAAVRIRSNEAPTSDGRPCSRAGLPARAERELGAGSSVSGWRCFFWKHCSDRDLNGCWQAQQQQLHHHHLYHLPMAAIRGSAHGQIRSDQTRSSE